MNVTAFYEQLIKPPNPWYVCRVEVNDGSSQVAIWLEHRPSRFPCPECGKRCTVYDHTSERQWRHLDTCEYETWLHARLPRIDCSEHGKRQVALPFAEPFSRMTNGMEKHGINILLECSRRGASKIARVTWDQLNCVMDRAVKRGMNRRSDILPESIGIDEKQVFSRHRYFTIIADLTDGTVIDTIDKRTIKAISPWFEERRDPLKKVKAAAMDMNAGYANVIAKYAPQADICFDHFHVTQIVTKALDTVRKEEQKTLPEELRKNFFHSRYLFLSNQENVPKHRSEHFQKLKAMAVRTSRGWAIKENLRQLWKCKDPEDAQHFFKKWYWWATHSRLEPMRKAAHTLKKHWKGIRNAIVNKISNAAVEGINSKIEKIKRDAFGFRNKRYFRAAILFHCGGMDLYPALS